MYQLFSYNAEIEYKSSLLSKATAFTVTTVILYLVLPFFVAYRSNGFWLQSYYFYEQPSVGFNYNYLLIADTDDPDVSIICGIADGSYIGLIIENMENCAIVEIDFQDFNGDEKQDLLQFKTKLIAPKDRVMRSIYLIIGVDVQLTTTCPLHMQSLLILNKEFSHQPSSFKYRGDLHLIQSSHLPCQYLEPDTRYNYSNFTELGDSQKSIVDSILAGYLQREVISSLIPISSRTQYGNTGNVELNFIFRVPEMHIRYLPNLLQELKWAWPQYLSLVFIFYFIFNRIKKFVFGQRLVAAYEVMPWKPRVI